MAAKILIIDDEEIVRQLLVETLEQRGHLVETAEDGSEAFEKVKRDNFSLVITDLKMPRMDGIEVLKEIKKDNPYIEVLVITGYPTIETAVEAIRIGAFDFISKPFDLQVLLAIIEHALEKQKNNLEYFQLSEVTALLEASKMLVVDKNVDTFLTKILDSALEITKAQRGLILLVDEKTKELKSRAARGISRQIIDSAKVLVPDGITEKITQEAVSYAIAAIEEEYKVSKGQNSPLAPKAFLSVPLCARAGSAPHNVLGLIILFEKISRDSFSERDHTLLSVLAGQVAVTIENCKLIDELQSKISDLNQAIEQLRGTQAQLIQSEKLSALGRFASGVAHEVKNPLGIILGGMEFLELKLPHADNDVKTAIQKIGESTLRANTIVQGLLYFSRPSQLKTQLLEPEGLVNEALSLFKFRMPLSNIKIQSDFGNGHMPIEVDKSQLLQVLFNILMNAVDAMPKGGTITIRAFTALQPEIVPEKSACVIEISDTGEGIAKEDLSKLFEPFFTTKREKKGTGLGLSVSKIIIENHRGTMRVESQQGVGTTVSVILPLAVPERVSEENLVHRKEK